ncbi:MAG: Tyrosine recombinase XerC [Mycoplasmataceae bacterium]|nr:MAG: Tyrosine recombinase XerC [Mycoplasmataceae bacterium]
MHVALPLLDYGKNFSMKSHVFNKTHLWDNTPKLTKLNQNQLENYRDWLELRNFSQETIEKYLRNINSYGDNELTTINITIFLRNNLSKFAPNTLRGQRNALLSYTKFLKIHHQIEWDIIARIIPQVQKKPFATLTEEEFEQLLKFDTKTDKLTKGRNNLIAQFFWYIGMRVSELINIKHSHYANGLLKLHGKGNKIREVIVPEFLIKHFNPCSGDYLFLTRHGRPLTKGQILRNIKRRAKLADITKNISLHTFRRSFATNSHNKGMRLDTIKKQLGHSNVNTTLEYIHNDYQTLYQDYSKLWAKEIKIS